MSGVDEKPSVRTCTYCGEEPMYWYLFERDTVISEMDMSRCIAWYRIPEGYYPNGVISFYYRRQDLDDTADYIVCGECQGKFGKKTRMFDRIIKAAKKGFRGI